MDLAYVGSGRTIFRGRGAHRQKHSRIGLLLLREVGSDLAVRLQTVLLD
jgi:hypothetical protein